ncbi:hypothetical protein LY78DRAFT_82523 [Colletotrichum sublineola]|nr:hypothetical protein LY78DRAFT_82523 [Colletotrichum sublineola]
MMVHIRVPNPPVPYRAFPPVVTNPSVIYLFCFRLVFLCSRHVLSLWSCQTCRTSVWLTQRPSDDDKPGRLLGNGAEAAGEQGVRTHCNATPNVGLLLLELVV